MVLVLLWLGIGRADGVAILGPSPEQEKRDRQRFEGEKQDRQEKQRKEEAAEKAAKEASYPESRREKRPRQQDMCLAKFADHQLMIEQRHPSHTPLMAVADGSRACQMEL